MPSAKSDREVPHAWATQLAGPAGKYPPLEPPRQVPCSQATVHVHGLSRSAPPNRGRPPAVGANAPVGRKRIENLGACMENDVSAGSWNSDCQRDSPVRSRRGME
jgi:hypothetical protein